MPEALVGGLAPRDRLEHEVDRRAVADQAERRRHVRQHAALGRDVELETDLLQHIEERMGALGTVVRRIDADHRIAGTEQEAVENARCDAAQVVSRMVGLQSHREPSA